jgi:hypothetical protein
MNDGNPGGAGWATFEARVRARRFARCLERASASIDTGAIDDAREALDEARELYPDSPEVAQLSHRLAAEPGPSAALLSLSHAEDFRHREPPAGWTRVAAAVGTLTVLFGLFGFWIAELYLARPAQVLLSTDVSEPSREPVGAAEPPAPTSGTSAAAEIPNRFSSAPPAVSTAASAAPSSNMRRTSPPAATPPPATASSGTPARSAPGARNTTGVPASRAAESSTRAAGTTGRAPLTAGRTGFSLGDRNPTTPAPEAALPRESPAAAPDSLKPPPAETRTPAEATAPTVPAVADAAPGAVPPPVPALDTSAPAARPAAATTSRAEESAQIRGVLTRYETAYNRLDAASATSVWPSVDREALDRAFKGLVSQRVSLGLCDITVIGDVGGASCAGKARWEPRVGGGLQTADRHWTFNLRKTTEGWRIEQIRVR